MALPQTDIFKNYSQFKRINNILIGVSENNMETPIIKFRQNFIDKLNLNNAAIDYIKRYCDMFPDLIEILEVKQNIQLNLF